MKACFMGLGYIGLPTSIIAAKNGIQILGVDIDPKVVEKTNAGAESLFTVLLLLSGAPFALRALPLYRCVTPRNAILFAYHHVEQRIGRRAAEQVHQQRQRQAALVLEAVCPTYKNGIR